ncbi:hypothetical protein Prudu_008701 [Prunus dulcis]|uniref:Uncharacterized protein n=1 Tax=Prunus dulcis TaxID=3755 RepID=A0A4Y1R4T9_PRUDU|nr:hypothetical protein Prudu_008701 [Prunus dulcis]
MEDAFCERAIGSTRTEMTLSSRWKILNKELAKWRNALAKAMDNHRSGKTLAVSTNVVWCYWARQKKFQPYPLLGGGKRFQIIPTGPTVVLNETPLHETGIGFTYRFPDESRLIHRKGAKAIGRKAAKAKRWSNSSKNASKFLEELSKHQAMRIEMDLKQQEHDMAIQLEYAKEREYVRKEREYVREQNIEKKIGKPWPWIQAICPLKQNNFGS